MGVGVGAGARARAGPETGARSKAGAEAGVEAGHVGGADRSICVKHIPVVVRRPHVRRPEIGRIHVGRRGCGIALANAAFDRGVEAKSLTLVWNACLIVSREHLTGRKGFAVR